MHEPLIFVERKGTDCAKWDGLMGHFGAADLDALWVADMDFKAPAGVVSALQDWATHGAYGYYATPKSYLQSFADWEQRRHGYTIDTDWVRFSPGVVSAVYWLVSALTQPGDGVLVLTPVYYPFFGAVEDTGRRLLKLPLQCDAGRYTVDFDAFRRTVETEKPAVFILCSPHNPIGRVWTEEELRQLLTICRENGITVISDEIHHDLIPGERAHIPAASLGIGDVITCTSASKTFNLAGLCNSFIVIPQQQLRDKFDAHIRLTHPGGGATPGYIAARTAYETGEGWLESLLEQVRENERIFRQVLGEKLPKAVISPLEGTYLLWVDLRAYLKPEQVKDVIQGQCKLAVDYGDWFGGDDFRCFLRINLATGSHIIRRAAEKLAEVLGK